MNKVFGIFQECFVVPASIGGEANELEQVLCHAFGVSADKEEMDRKCELLNINHIPPSGYYKKIYKVLPISLI